MYRKIVEYTKRQVQGFDLLDRDTPVNLGKEDVVKISLEGSSTMANIAPELALACETMGLWPDIRIGEFNGFAANMYDAKSPLYKFKPEIVFLFALLDSFRSFAEITELVSAFTSKTDSFLVIHNFIRTMDQLFCVSGAQSNNRVQEYNEALVYTYKDNPQVYILDMEKICSYHGYESITNPKFWYLGKMFVSETFLPVLVEYYMAFIKAIKGNPRKCLVLDLDGVLWGGVIGEDGIEGVKLSDFGTGREFYDFQKAILNLHNRGVILAVNSKNNFADAMQMFESHPHMLLKDEHFASIQINWDDKATNMRRIAEEINIGIDSLVFLDDSPTEREWVRQAVPEVLVIDLPEDPAYYVKTLQHVTDFEALTLTKEDKIRGKSYAAQRQRKVLKEKTKDFDSYIKSLNIVLEIGQMNEAEIERVAQLSGRTNQFNMTTRRYTVKDLDRLFVKDDDAYIYIMKARDKFSDLGLVGVIIIKEGKIDSFFVSCRALGRTMEEAFLHDVLWDMKDIRYKKIQAEYIPTAKNKLVEDFYTSFGSFEQNTDNVYTIDLEKWRPKRSALLTIHRR